MKNVTIAIATTFALVTTGLALEAARRHISAEASSAPPIANADARVPATMQEEFPAAAQAPAPGDVHAENPLTAPAPAEAVSTAPGATLPDDGPSMRDASLPAPSAASPPVDASQDAEFNRQTSR